MGITNFPHGLASMGVPVLGNGIPLTVGEVFYLVTAKTAADAYYTRLSNLVDDDRIFSTLASAYTNMTTLQGDVLIVCPGSHAQTASLTWSKADTAIIGMMPHRATYHAAGQPRIVCTTAAVASILNINAANVSMFNIGTYNAAADSGNLYDIIITKNNFYAEGCHFRGGNNTTQTTASSTAPAGVPITLAADGSAANGGYFKDCTIGSSGNAVRTKGPGCFFVPASSGGFGLTFESCTFSMWSTAGTGYNLSMVYLVGNASIARELLFKKCFFYNFCGGSPGTTEELDVCIQDGSTSDHSIVLMDCVARGVTAWTSNSDFTWVGSGAQPVAHGGISVKADIT